MLWEESSAEFCAQIPAVAQHILGGRPIPGFGGKRVVVWERSSAELRGKEVAKGCVGTKWHRVGWRQSGAQVWWERSGAEFCADGAVQSFCVADGVGQGAVGRK